MYYNDMLTRLRNGDNPDLIAQEYTDALNHAIAAYDAERAAAEAAARKENVMDDLTAAFNQFFDMMMPGVGHVDRNMVSTVMDIMTNAFVGGDVVDSGYKIEAKSKNGEAPKVKITTYGNTDLAGNEIAKFLESYGLK